MLSNYRVGVLYFYASMVSFGAIFLFAFAFLPRVETYDHAYKSLKNSIFAEAHDGEVPYFISCNVVRSYSF